MSGLSTWGKVKVVISFFAALAHPVVAAGGIRVFGTKSRRQKIRDSLLLLESRTPERWEWVRRHLIGVVAGKYTAPGLRNLPALVTLDPEFVDAGQGYQIAAYLCHAAKHCEWHAASLGITLDRVGLENDVPRPSIPYDQGRPELDAVQIEVEVLRELGASEDECLWVSDRADHFRDVEKVAWVPGIRRDVVASLLTRR